MSENARISTAVKGSAMTTRSALITPSSGIRQPGQNQELNPAQYENTFRMVPSKGFPRLLVSEIIKNTLEEQLDGKEYDPIESSSMAKDLADLIKQKVKGTQPGRYKIVTYVSVGGIGELQPALNLSSQCLWNEDFDGYADCVYRNTSLYVTVIVYAIYAE